jgi:hypothetical protein
MDIVPQCKPSIQSRFSTLIYMKVVKKFNPIQRSFISKHDLDNLLKLPDHLMVPMNLLQWTSHGEEKVFLHKEKNINFSKERNRNIVSIQGWCQVIFCVFFQLCLQFFPINEDIYSPDFIIITHREYHEIHWWWNTNWYVLWWVSYDQYNRNRCR